MIWRRWGLKDNPYAIHEIDETTLDLFAGRSQEIKLFQNAFAGNKRIIFLEGDPGIGKTSLGNYWRYSAMQKRLCFTPYTEICISQPQNIYPVALRIIEAISWSLPQNHPFVIRDPEFRSFDKKFKELLSQLVNKTWHEIDLVEDPYLTGIEELFNQLIQILSKLSYDSGVLIQITFAGPRDLENIFKKKLWKLMALDGIRWLLIGGSTLKEQLYCPEQNILPDDLYRISVKPLELPQIYELLMRRKDYLAMIQNATLPLAPEVIDYLYFLSNGNLKKIFQVCQRIAELMNCYEPTAEINLKTAKPLIAQHLLDEIRGKWKLSQVSTEILNSLVKEEGLSPGIIAQKIKKLRPNVSKNLSYLMQTDLIRLEVKGRHRVYYPSVEAKIAFA